MYINRCCCVVSSWRPLCLIAQTLNLPKAVPATRDVLLVVRFYEGVVDVAVVGI